jgi:hypothetical protein
VEYVCGEKKNGSSLFSVGLCAWRQESNNFP